ncbi:hypothetical protein HCN44_010643 [Aphidius gifuensis]|uniref:Kinesin motor domain-containing protein n=1 Tax=Aphidius gifuensis TaxID=684658 RepID=A0A834XSN5_APHGI|nr:hypothetical protein HCN44_010643 [Aphidius gifuensis]
MSDNIKVAIKVRPLIKREKEEQAKIQWTVQENTISHIGPKIGKADSTYQFDHIFDSGKTNHDVFEATARPIVDAAMKGYNGTIFAYGQTSSGKTYTMMGCESEPGVIPLSVNRIFNFIENDPVRVYLLRVSYLEIYNEKIHDLLRKDTCKDNDGLKIKEDLNGNVTVDCTAIVANSSTEVLRAMKIGDKARRVGDTNMNERSSRSHTIFRIEIESCEKANPEGATISAQLNLIDLAGSERPKTTGATGERFNEGRHINSSLSTLSLVIKQLSENGNGYINFRDSKLTRILQTSLGGNAMTTIICAVTPAGDEETECTLAFAQRAKGIKNKPCVNKTISDQVLIKKMFKQVNNLTAQIDQMESKLLEKDKQILFGRIELLTTRMLSGQVKESINDRQGRNRRRTWGGPGMNFAYRELPTIEENEQLDKQYNDEEEKKNYAKRRQIEIPDFEWELIKAEKERLRQSNGSTDGEFDCYDSAKKRIQFAKEDDMRIIESPCCTPEKKYQRETSPDTPKNVLRNKIISLETNYNDLREFTTLEQQISQEDSEAAAKYRAYEKNMAFLQKTLADSEQICRDTNKKYAELQSEFAILSSKHDKSTDDCKNLTQQIESLHKLRDNYVIVESEKDDFKTKYIEANKKIDELEGESSSYAFELEHLKVKFKKREQELEASLNTAWEELKSLTGLDQDERKQVVNKEIVELQSVVDNVNEKLRDSFNENTSLNDKIQELEIELKKLQDSNSLLTKQVDEFSQCHDDIDKLSKKICQLENDIIDKDNQIESFESIKVNNNLLLQQIQELKNTQEENINKINKFEILIADKECNIAKIKEESSNQIDELNRNIEQLNANYLTDQQEYMKKIKELEDIVDEKNKEISNLEAMKLEYNLLAKELEESKLNHSTIKDEFSKKISQLEEIATEKDGQLKNLETTKLEIDSLIKELEESKMNKAAVEEESLKKINQLEEIIAEKDGQLKHLEMKISEFDSLIKELEESKINKATIEEESLKKINQLEEIIAEQNSQLKNIETTKLEIDLLNKELEDSKANKSTVEKESLEKIKQLEEAIAEKDAQLKNLETKNSDVDLLNKELEDLKNNKLIIEEENIKKIKQLEELISEKDLKLNENLELNSKYLEAENKLTTSNELIDKLKIDIDQIQLNLNEKNEELINMKSRFDELENLHKQQQNQDTLNIENELSSLTKLMSIKNDEIQTAISQIESQESEISRLNKLINDSNDTQTKATELIEQQKNELLDTKENIMALETEIAERNNAMKNLEKLLENKTIELTKIVEDFENKIACLESEKEHLKNELNDVVTMMEEKDEKFLKIKDEVNKICAERELLLKEISQLKEEPDQNVSNNNDTDKKIDLTRESEVTEKSLINNHEVTSNKSLNSTQLNSSCLNNKNIDLVTSDNDSSSMFANGSYFENMSMSVGPGDSVFANSLLSNKSCYENGSIEQNNKYISHNETTLLLDNTNKNTSIFNDIIITNDIGKLNDKTIDELKSIINEFINLKITLEEENIKLEDNLKLKIREIEELKNDFKDFGCDMENLQKTVQLLSTENSELTVKLSQEKEQLINMKIKFENEIKKLNDNIQNDNDNSQILIELKKQIENLTKEHDKLFENLTEKNKNFDEIQEKLTVELSKNTNLKDENIELSNNLMDKIEECDLLTDKLRSYESSKLPENNKNELNMLNAKIQELKLLNSKLIEEKLTSCSQCVHLIEKNEFRKALKNDIRNFNIKLKELQKKFDQESADAEILRSKVNQDLDTSINELSLNTSIMEGVDVSYAEEKIQLLQAELDNVQQNYDKLSSRYREQSEEIDRLRDSSVSPDNSCLSDDLKSSKSNIKREEKICSLEKILSQELNDINYIKKKIENINIVLQKLKTNKQTTEAEIDALKLSNKLADEKLVDSQFELDKLKSQLTNLDEQIEKLMTENKSIKDVNSALDLEIVNLNENLNNTKEKNEELIKEFELFKSSQSTEIESLNKIIKEYKESTKKLETSIEDLNNKLDNCNSENLNLKDELTRLQNETSNTNILNKTDNQMEICDNYDTNKNDENSKDEMLKALDELEEARLTIKKEISSLKQCQSSELSEYNDKTVAELFQIFITVIMTKEQEIIKKLMYDNEKEKKKLIEKLNETERSKLRLTNWSKELEADVERLQSQLSSHEEKTSGYISKILNLENLIKEYDHEKLLINEKMNVMESDFNTLQIDYEKLKKGEVTSAIQSSQNIDKQIEKVIENYEIECNNKINKIDKEYKFKIDELTNSNELLKTKNIELQSNLDCQEANERQLKSIVDLKTNEYLKLTTKYDQLNEQFKQINNSHVQLTQDNSQNIKKLDEITLLLKKKCDKLSEYKNQLETIQPNYDIIKEQFDEREIRLEKYKTEVTTLRDENSKQLIILQNLKDKFEVEKIKINNLNQQLDDLTNKNTTIQFDYEKIKEKCEEFESENQRLIRRMRNSTEREIFKQQTADLIDKNNVLQQNLDGASNRIVELQTSKSELLKLKIDYETKYNNISQEYEKLNTTFDNYKKKTESRRLDISFDEKYDDLVQEKNRIALELEEKKSMCLQYEKKITILEAKNKELDDEMNDMVQKIHETEHEKDLVDIELYDLKGTIENERASCKCRNNNNKTIPMSSELIKQCNELKYKLNNSYNNNNDSILRESKSTSSSRSTSPTPLSSKRKQRRSDLFNKNRPSSLTEELTVSEDTPLPPCQQCDVYKNECELLRQQMIKLEQSSALKSNHIKSLQLQLEAETFPYKKKCQEYQSILTAFKKEKHQMNLEIHKLAQSQLNSVCQRCKNWNNNKHDKSVQCIPPREPIAMLSRPSGIVEQHMEVEKLKSDKVELKKLCLSRRTQIVELQKTIDLQNEEIEKLRNQVAIKFPIQPVFKK